MANYVRDAIGKLSVTLPNCWLTDFPQGKSFDPFPRIFFMWLFSGVQLPTDCAAN